MINRGYYCEKWFLTIAHKLRILNKNPNLELVKEILSTYLPSKYSTASKFIENQLDVTEYLDLVLKIDAILNLEDSNNKKYKVAVDLTLNPNTVPNKLREINQYSFSQIRQKLEIDKHLVIILPNNYQSLDPYEIAEGLYEAIDNNQQVVDFTQNNSKFLSA